MSPRKQEQGELPGIPQPPKRKVIQEIENLCLERDRLCGQRTAIGDEIVGTDDQIQAELVARNLPRYTYKDDNGVLQDVERTEKLRKKKSAANPKPKSKKAEDAA